MDVIYILNCLFIKVFVMIIEFFQSRFCPESKWNLNFLETLEDKIFEACFEMQKSEVAGFRRLRTISQMLFETIPQICLQLRMYYYFSVEPEMGVSLDALFISIACAVVHGSLEVLVLYIESE
jgi:hypothetical protein